MQNCWKIRSRTASGVRFPDISSNARRASSRSASSSSSAAPPAAADAARRNAASAAMSRSTCRAFETAGVSRNGIPPSRIPRIASRTASAALPSIRQVSSTSGQADTSGCSAGDHAAGRSRLFTTTSLGRAAVSASSARSSASSARDRSRTTTTAAATPSAARARRTPSASASSVAARIPAVSTRVTGIPPRSMVSVTRSRVVPAVPVTMARCAPHSSLNRDDLPVFGRPATATWQPSRINRPRRAAAIRAFTCPARRAASAPAACASTKW